MTEKSTEEDSTAGNIPTILCTFPSCRKLYLFPKYHPEASTEVLKQDDYEPVIKGRSY